MGSSGSCGKSSGACDPSGVCAWPLGTSVPGDWGESAAFSGTPNLLFWPYSRPPPPEILPAAAATVGFLGSWNFSGNEGFFVRAWPQ